MLLNPTGLALAHGVCIFIVGENPNAATVEANPNSLVAKNYSLPTAALGSLALRYDTGTLYVKTAAADATHPTGVWTQK